MSDGRIHGVHVWIGPPDMEPPDRPIPGPLVWDLTTGTATDTTESLLNGGWAPRQPGDAWQGVCRGSAQTRPQPERGRGALDDDQARTRSDALQFLGRHRPSWRTDHDRFRRAGPAGRARRRQPAADPSGNELARRTRGPTGYTRLPGPAHPQGVGAARRLSRAGRPDELDALKWLDDPVPFFDWRASMAGDHVVHPEDRDQMARMAEDFRQEPLRACFEWWPTMAGGRPCT